MFQDKKKIANCSDEFQGLRPNHFILFISAIFSVFCFIPMFNIRNYSATVDDYNSSLSDNSKILQVSYASLLVCILPGLDYISDLVPISLIGDKILISEKESSISTAVRMSKIEKLFFFLGVLSYSAVVFPPFQKYSALYPADAGKLFLGFENMSTILTICPIMSLLYRVSTTWNATFAVSISLSICLTSFFSSLSEIYPLGSTTRGHLFITAGVCMNIGTLIYFVVCGLSTYRTIKWWLSTKPQNEDSPEENRRAITEQKFRNVFTAAHISATSIQMVINSIWYCIYSVNFDQMTIFIYFVLGSSILTFLIEFRLRKAEVIMYSNEMIAQLDSKKSYVRYISHELRTPLNAATLGLKLISDDIKNCPNLLMAQHPRAADLVECLDDVQLACGTSVNILNDLLSFEKLDSGILELHRENIPIVSFATDSIKIFSGQAREKDMELVLDLAVTAEEKQAGLCEITEQDELSADRFKMEQVLRNLVSNAIKFSSSNSAVKIQMYFKPKSSSDVLVGATQKHRFFNELLHHQIDYYMSSDIENSSIASTNDTSIVTTKGFWVLKVTDTGAGISQENQKKLFRGVVQFSPEKLQAGGGSGFGLFICKGIVELHKGLLYVESAGEGRGSTFTMELPMERKIDPYSTYYPATHGSPRRSRADTLLLQSTSADSLSSTAIQEYDSGKSSVDYITDHLSLMSVQSSDRKISSPFADGDGVMGAEESKSCEIFSHLQLSEDKLVFPKFSSDENTSHSLQPPSPYHRFTEHGGENQDGESLLNSLASAIAEGTSAVDSHNKAAQYRLLIVDDSSMNRKLLSKVVTAAGHTCDVAEDGLVAVEKIKAQLASTGSSNGGSGGGVAYDGILMDFIMPNMDGPTATKVIRDLKVTIPIFGVTGNCMKREVEWFLESGANSVLFKPFDLAEFDRKMQEALSKRDR